MQGNHGPMNEEYFKNYGKEYSESMPLRESNPEFMEQLQEKIRLQMTRLDGNLNIGDCVEMIVDKGFDNLSEKEIFMCFNFMSAAQAIGNEWMDNIEAIRAYFANRISKS